MSLLVVSTELVDITKDFGKVVDITKLVNITKVVAISLLDRDGLRPSCELRRASKPVRFPFPLRGFKIVSFLMFTRLYAVHYTNFVKLNKMLKARLKQNTAMTNKPCTMCNGF